MRVSTTAAVIALVASAGAAQADTYDLASMFGTTNPSGPWSYGYYFAGTGYNLYTNYRSGAIESWVSNALPQTAVFGTPSDAHNTTGGYLTSGSVTLAPGQATFHPGQNDETGFYAFTAPTAGTYGISANFGGLDFVGPTDTLVTIATTGDMLFSGTVDGYQGDPGRAAFGPSPSLSYTGSVDLAAGQQLLFEVAFDPSGTRGTGPFFYDTTGISATLTSSTVSAVPEPAVLAVLGTGMLGLALVRRRA